MPNEVLKENKLLHKEILSAQVVIRGDTASSGREKDSSSISGWIHRQITKKLGKGCVLK